MSQGALAASRLAATIRPGRADGYADLIAARLRRLAAAGRTGMLPFTGDSDGAIYFSGGRVVFAESARTPASARRPGARPRGPGSAAVAALAAAEPIADATLDLLASQSSPARFRSAKMPAAGLADGFSVTSLLAEAARRQRILGQLAGIVQADTIIVRNPRLARQQVQVSAPQWAVLIRVRDGSTARTLAWDLGRSVFGMTIDVYRLLALGLLSAAECPARPGTRPPREPPGRGRLAMSFLLAVSARDGGAT